MPFFEILLFLVILAFAGVVFLLYRKMSQMMQGRQDDKSFLLLNQNMQGVQERIDKSTQAVNAQLGQAAEAVARVSKELGAVQEMGRQMRALQDFLKSPKLRGNIGEQVLRDLLEQSFSREHFAMQYKFKEGQVVDAVIKTDKGIVPIDAKFPMENFQKMSLAPTEEEQQAALHEFGKDVRKHISDISKKYILPDEGTVEFAVMYVPAEAIYYEIIRHDDDLQQFAHEKKVLVVSPNSFYYFLKVLLIGMEGKKIEENIKRVQELLGGIHKDAAKFSETLSVLNTHMTNAKSAVDRVNTEYAKLNGKIDQVKLLKEG